MNQSDFPQRAPFTFDRVVRILFTVCTIVALVFFLDSLKGVLLPFLVACLIAYMLEPIVRWNMKWTKMKSRFVPVLLTLLEATALLALFCVIFIPYLISETTQMTKMLRDYATTQIHIPYISSSIHEFIRENIDFILELPELGTGLHLRHFELADRDTIRHIHNA